MEILIIFEPVLDFESESGLSLQSGFSLIFCCLILALGLNGEG